MEELQDALEDAQYVNAINVDEGPRPIIAWEHPSDEVLEKWKLSLLKAWENDTDKANKLKPFDFEWTLSSSLGLFLFSSHLKEGSGDHVRMCFIEEVLRWRCLRGRSRGMKLRKIYERYLLRCPTEIDEETKAVKNILPKLSLIDEVDMAYIKQTPRMDEATLNDFIQKNVDESCSKCSLGIDGPLREEILTTIEKALSSLQVQMGDHSSSKSCIVSEKLSHMPDFSSLPEINSEVDAADNNTDGVNPLEAKPEEATANLDIQDITEAEPKKPILTGSRSHALSSISDCLFDKVEQVILECLRRKYWSAFAQKGVTNWDKLMNFLWHESQPVVEEDFFLMRVLGRGGFGLVSGK